MISVIICTRNRSESLNLTLQSVARMSVEADCPWELIIVDNNSTDRTKKVVDEFSRSVSLTVRYVFEGKPGLSNARNTGVAHAKGDVLAYIDDDVLIASDYVSAVRRVFEDRSLDGVQGRVQVDLLGPRPVWFDEYFEGAMGLDRGGEACELTYGFMGANMLIRAEVFQKIGGFSPELGAGTRTAFGEDAEFSYRMRRQGYRIVYSPRISLRHQVSLARLTQPYFKKRFFEMGQSQAFYQNDVSGNLLRFTLYSVKELLLAKLQAVGYVLSGKKGEALSVQCEALTRAGFMIQRWRFMFGARKSIAAPKVTCKMLEAQL